jgi:hypothetical protein
MEVRAMSVNWSVSKSGMTADEIGSMVGEEESVPADKLTQIRDIIHGLAVQGALGDPAGRIFDVSISASENGATQVSVTSSLVDLSQEQ